MRYSQRLTVYIDVEVEADSPQEADMLIDGMLPEDVIEGAHQGAYEYEVNFDTDVYPFMI